MNVILHLTHDCQLRCAYCYGGPRHEGRMSWEVARRALDLFFEQSSTASPDIPQISFFGGEPLLEWDLLQQCVAYAESRKAAAGQDFRLTITTNGLALDRNRAEYLRSKNVGLLFSFDGAQEAQDATRRLSDGRSSFADTRRALGLVLGVFDNPAVCAVVSPENVAFLPESIDFLLGEGVRQIMLNPNFFAEWDEQHRDLWTAGYEHAARRFEESYRQGVPLNIHVFTAKIITHLQGGYGPCDVCDFGSHEIAIAPSGRIYPCQRMVGDDRQDLGLLGNVFDGLDPRAAAELAACRQVRAPACGQCAIRSRCRNWCSCVNHALTGRFDQPGGIICFHEQLAVRLADRAASRLFQEKNKLFLETYYLEKQFAPEWV
jgi:uncharacterized protein